MSLRAKTLLFMLIALVVMIGSLYIASRATMMRGLERIEEQDAQMYVNRAFAALTQEVSDLERIATRWSSWDDTYRFIEDANNRYIESNLSDETFIVQRLNMMLFVNSSGRLISGKAFDLKSEKESIIPAEFISGSLSGALSAPGGITSGVLLTMEGPMIIVAQPILTSVSEGPARGTVFLGRYINDDLTTRLARTTLSELTLYRLDNLPSDFPASLLPLADNTAALVRSADGQHIAAYTRIKDIYGRPVLAIRVTLPRQIYVLGQDAVVIFIMVILGIALVVGGLFLWLMHKQVLTRLAVLVRGINRIASTGDTATRISVAGKDELALVAGTINGTLAVLNESQEELRKLYQEEKDLREKLEEEIANRAEYTRALVHELKTPITPILAASELLLDEVTAPTIHTLAMNIHRSSSNLNKRIDELLDLARGEIGQLKLNIGPVDMKKLLQETIEEAQSQTMLRKQSISLETPPALHTIWADKERLHQVVQNLLNNAVKFTLEGGKIAVRAKEDGNDMVVEVEDNGSGISEEEQKRLFDPYHRRESDRERLSGLGLGLAIAKRFIDLHGGRIWVTSTPGKGTVFTFTVPLNAVGWDGQPTE